jgi:unsaturated chondroitin disaccharide hydrolase
MIPRGRQEALNWALHLIKCSLDVEEGFPHITRNARWQRTPDGGWTGGFWVGLLWLAYRLTGETRFASAARARVHRLEPHIEAEDADFDLGFLFYTSAALGYQITGDRSLRDIALRAADRMLSFMHPHANLIYCIYPERTNLYGRLIGSSIVDIMANLQLLWWATDESGQSCYAEIATRHAERTVELFLRPDGSSFQVVDFDLETGQILGRGTVHGFDDNTCWSRGQAWGIYGFALAAREIGDPRFVQAARRMSDYYLEKSPLDRAPYWDFKDPAVPKAVQDSSAAAITCAAWLCYCADNSDLQEYYAAGMQLLETLYSDYLQSEGNDGILSHGCAYKKLGIGIDESTIWGDYYFLQALLSA